eukprot:TRINITY_DN8504_c0_g1_i1.p1 TRINITY_DN8504_c0_g1~~TRINITY_DN8504_c0_g1_i1.p1  ORF type:complete len:228 (+),score=40.34 TRINITY_DN8504_c0_g1_i1:42-725(+)
MERKRRNKTTRKSIKKKTKSRKSPQAKFSKRKLLKWYQSYEDVEEEEIVPEGILRFCEDLNYKPEEFKVLCIAWMLKAKRMGFFTQEEFMKFADYRIDSTKSLKKHLNIVCSVLKENEADFKSLYNYAFQFSKEDEHKRYIDIDSASEMMKLVLGPTTPHLQKFLSFLKQQTTYKGINKDQWATFLDFSQTVAPDYSNYDVNSAWPVLYDVFVSWAKGEPLPDSETF